MTEEIWKDVLGYENLYQVSSLGRVKSLRANKEKILKESFDKDGYISFALYKNSKSKRFKAHRIVALSFLLNLENKVCVNHINGIKIDNRLENLEWSTHSENTIHARDNGLLSILKPVLQYSLDGVLIREWKSTMDIQRELGIPSQNISAACLGYNNTNSVRDCRWKYKDDNMELEFRALRKKPVIVIDLLTGEEKTYVKVRDAAVSLSMCWKKLGSILREEVKTCKELNNLNKSVRYK